MNPQQKAFFQNWAKRKKMKSKSSSGDLALISIIQDLHTQYAFNPNETFLVYKNHVHPALFFRYLGDWSKCKHLSESDWRNINREWMEICWKNKYWKEGIGPFNTYDELKDAINDYFGDQQINCLSYQEAADSLRRIAEEIRKQEKKELSKRKEATMEELEKALSLGDSKEVVKQSKEARRIAKEEETHNFRELTNAINSGESIPNKPIFTMPEPKQTTLKDVFEASQIDTSKFMEASMTEDFLKSQIPSIKKNQILIYKGVLKAHYEFNPGFPYLKVRTVYSTNKRYLTFGEVPGIGYSINGENQLTIENPDLCTAFLELYKANKWLLLTLSENVSENEELNAYEITDALFK